MRPIGTVQLHIVAKKAGAGDWFDIKIVDQNANILKDDWRITATSYTDHSTDITSDINTLAKVNALTIEIYAKARNGAAEVHITHVYLVVNGYTLNVDSFDDTAVA